MEWIEWIENSIGILFLVCYAYQIFYMVEVLVRKPRQVQRSNKLYRYAFVVSARNEEGVIGGLLDSLFGQDYPRNLMDVFVVADNCTRVRGN